MTTPAMQDYLKAIHRLQVGAAAGTPRALGSAGDADAPGTTDATDAADATAATDATDATHATDLHPSRDRPGVSTNALAGELAVSAASATNMAKRLAELGLVHHEPYQGVRLTAKGERAALEVIRVHRLLELFLVETLGLSWDQVHEEAEVLEHHISDELSARIAEVLGHPKRDPHGDPIPQLGRDGPGAGTPSYGTANPERDGVPLSESDAGTEAPMLRVANQDPDVLRFLGEHGLYPGAVVRVDHVDPPAGVVRVHVDGANVHLGMDVAAAIFLATEHDPVSSPEEATT